MLPKVSKGFRAIFVAVMCVVCVALCVLAVRLAQQGEQLRLTQLQLDASLARLKLQRRSARKSTLTCRKRWRNCRRCSPKRMQRPRASRNSAPSARRSAARMRN